ncbi:DNA sulfur modification protein DndD [Ruegeria atlantica]|uniref:DNA sulfur modification protein DndD n=1 Tax=Ruegeria atlantica TaxID=81569 RepID=A0AA90YZV4_9RHOB|nr:DNA sulfur modification protein DndD [Ruegeria atlantica]NOE18079.1 DNA sulfur modification protein DndD [Ruegeria atlantica]
MILHSLRIFNFGLYGGEHRFDLAPDSEGGKPVVLVIGHNGAGKTTFLESVRLALYGKRALGARVGQAEYERHLLKRINNFATDRQASLELAFTSQHLGKEDIYTVRRTWAARGASVVESLEFERNGKPVDDIPSEDWNHYLEDIIPAGVSQLFFFDGEKIQDIADDQENTGLTEAIKSLLGIDILDQLRGDLALYKSRSMDREGDANLEGIQRDLNVARSDLVLTEEEIGSLSAKRTQLARRSEASQKVFEQEGGSIALSRDTLLDELKNVEADLTKQTNALKALVNGVAPFALAPKLLAKFSADVEQARTKQSGPAIDAFVSSFEDAMTAGDSASWTASHFASLRDFARNIQVSSSSMVLSTEPDWVVGKLASIADERVKVATLSAQLSELQKHRTVLKDQLKNFRPGAAAGAFDDLKRAEFELGLIEAELNRKQADATQARALIERLERELRKSQDAVFALARAEEKRDLATRAQAALNDYEERIVELRLASLSKHFIEAFSGLVTRKSLVCKVIVDPNTFQLKLLGETGNEITPLELSAGERQLFAISMLWALGRTSGRELPMIIDTPLSRLDRQHRTNLMSNYVPRTSAQVIMLCTDTELTPDLAETIAPYVSRRFEIGAVVGGQRTEITLLDPEQGVQVLEASNAH